MNPTSAGTLETVYKILDFAADPLAMFDRLRAAGEGFLLESADIDEKSGRLSTGCAAPSLKITIRGGRFIIRALDGVGRKYLQFLTPDFPFMEAAEVTADSLGGRLPRSTDLADEETRLKEPDVFDVLRRIAFRLQPVITLDLPFCGLFGVIGYDAVDYFEALPPSPDGGLPDMEFYWATRLFVVDHLQQKTYLIASYPVIDQTANGDQFAAMEQLQRLEQAAREAGRFEPPPAPAGTAVTASVTDSDFGRLVQDIRRHIAAGDIFQCVVSRTFSTPVDENPLQIYARLKAINPGPYMFYFQTPDYVLLGSSPETCLKVSGSRQKTVEIRPIAGTLPRGRRQDHIDPELDARYELELLHNRKELAEHCMLLDLARNDIAKVSVPGTRHVPRLLTVEKYSHVQHLVSTVRGTLRPDLDALHAYRATMNMGTLTGAPKIKAMELIRRYEKEKRNFYGGAVCYLTPLGDFDSCIVIRAVTIRDGVARVQAGAGIVYDSDPQSEADETRRKADACLQALGVES